MHPPVLSRQDIGMDDQEYICFSMRELLEQALAKMTLIHPHETGEILKPYDCSSVELLTLGEPPHPLMVVSGANYQEAVRKHCFDFAVQEKKKTAFLCDKATPLQSVLSLVSLATGLSQSDPDEFRVSPKHFALLNEALSALYDVDLTFCQTTPLKIDSVIALARRLKKQEGVEVFVVEGLHHIELESGKQTSQTEQRFVSALLRSVAHIGELTIVAGHYSPDDPFADLSCDSVFYCEGWGQTPQSRKGFNVFRSLWDKANSLCRLLCYSLSRCCSPEIFLL